MNFFAPKIGLAVFLFCFLSGLTLASPPQQDVPAPSEKGSEKGTEKGSEKGDVDVEKNLASFDQVWETIRKSHWDEKLVGDSWDEAKSKYRPMVEKAKTMEEVREALRSLIGELGQSHFGIIPADTYDVVDDSVGGDGFSGLEFRLIEPDALVVTRVEVGSPAAVAGVQPGWKLQKVGKRSADTLIQKLSSLNNQVGRVETMAGLVTRRWASGDVDESIPFEFLDYEGNECVIEIEMAKPLGTKAKFGNLPTMHVFHETQTLDGSIGYFRFNVFFAPTEVMKAYNAAVQNPEHRNGLIIDLRGNLGGIIGMTMGMARPFTSEQTKLGTMIMRSSELKVAVFPAAERYRAPVAVLVDECSISSAEILSGGLQDIGAAKIFGQRTAGLALPSTVVKLPNGDGFQFAFANYLSESGKSLEKDGVVPDFPIKLTRESLSKGKDPVLEAAQRWIKEQTKDAG